MKKILFSLLFPVFLTCSEDPSRAALPDDKDETPDPPASVADCKKCIVLSEQSNSRVAIADVDSKTIIWEWLPSEGVAAEHREWFRLISDAKPVYGLKYILATASGGGVALIRVSDKKTMFYAYAGGNTHSAELLPDGNIVSASSTGNFMTLFRTDTLNFPEGVKGINLPLEFGHNVVWDHTRQRLWTAAMDKMKVYEYNLNCTTPDLTLVETIDLPGTQAHDLFPVYGENSLWLTNTTHVYKFDPETKTTSDTNIAYAHIKSVSSGEGLPVIVIRPKEQWWTDEVIDANGNTVFYQAGLKIYKARWFVENKFSYPEGDHTLRLCAK